jgi:hypothetical protein
MDFGKLSGALIGMRTHGHPARRGQGNLSITKKPAVGDGRLSIAMI